MKNKLESLKKISNPSIVEKKIKELLGKDIDVFVSTQAKKKYMIKSPDGKWIHFGQMPYEDYTFHQDEERRQSFMNRNARWKNASKFTPAWLSYHILW